MKEYLENRIKELKKQFEIDKEKYINIPAERKKLQKRRQS